MVDILELSWGFGGGWRTKVIVRINGMFDNFSEEKIETHSVSPVSVLGTQSSWRVSELPSPVLECL